MTIKAREYMLEIRYKQQVNASVSHVWSVITETEKYDEWNPFVRRCQSEFKVGSSIIMHVKLIPGILLRQKETILDNDFEALLSYGVNIPFLLNSRRQHILTALKDGNSEYESTFIIKGLLAPAVKFMLEKRLRNGFSGMTDGLIKQAEKMRMDQAA